jgi:hypothetical protein
MKRLNPRPPKPNPGLGASFPQNRCTAGKNFQHPRAMSAKKSKAGANKPAAAVSAAPSPAPVAAGPAAATVAEPSSWLDSPDPRKRQWGKIILVGVWIYVAALWLLALDQTFHWGIFGPKLPPLP